MIHYGLDVGRFTDRTAMVGLDGDVVGEAHLMAGLEFGLQADILEPLIDKAGLCLVDATGLGVGLYERLVDMGLPVVPVTLGSTSRPRIIRPGHNQHGRSRGRVYVGKTYLIGRLLGVIQAREVTVAPWCCHREELKRELGQMSVGFTRRGAVTTQARRGHDDLAVAMGLAILARDLSSQLLRSVAHGPPEDEAA